MRNIYTFFCCLMFLAMSQLSATNFDVVNTGSNMTVFVTPNSVISGAFEDVSQVGIFYTNDSGELTCAGVSDFSGAGNFQITLWGSEAGEDNGMANADDLVWLAQSASGAMYDVTPSYQGEGMNTYTLNSISFITGLDFTAQASSDVLGCTDASALNYNAEANVSDDSCEYATPLVITTTVCTEATSVMMTGPWWGWDPAAGPVAASNGDGTWTFTFDVAPDADMEYLLVVDGVQENLVEANTASEDWSCTPITDYWSYANRQWTVGSGDVSNVYGTCGSECPTVEPEPTTASVEFTVDMNGVDQPSADYDQVTVNGSWNGWGAWGLPLTDEDADGIFTGTLELEAGTSFEYVVAVSGPADSWSGWGIQWGDGCSNANVSVTAGEVGSVTSSSLTPGCAEVLGCMDANATNYDSAATAQAYDQYGNLGCIFTSCDDIPEYGCIYGDGFGAFNAEFNADACVTYGGTPCEAAPTCEGTEATLTLMDSYGDGGGSVTIAGTNYELFTGASEDFALCLDLSSCISVTFVATDNYPGENSWSISDASGAVLAGAVAGDALFGSCVVGCMDASALNFDATAVIADNTLCEYSACEADEATLTLMDSYGDGGGSVTIAGTNYVLAGGASEDFPLCIDLSTCLTVTFVATDNWSTENSWSISDASGLLASGADTDGLFGGCVAACGDEDAENYNANADIVDNTLCEYSLVQGCMDATACNFDLAAEADNGSCTYAEAGFDCGGNCISGTLVTVDGGSYLAEKSWTIADCDGTELAAGGAPFAGCVDLGENYILNLVDSYGDGWDGTVMTILDATYTVETDVENIVIGSCGVAGCTDEAACNFSADATFDDGTCDVPAAGLDCDGNCISGTLVTVDGGSYPAEKSWDITSCDGTELASGGSPFAGCVDLSGTYTINLVDSYGDGWDGTLMTIADATYTVEAATATFDMGCAVLGCMDDSACNYNADADTDDSTCTFAQTGFDCDGNSTGEPCAALDFSTVNTGSNMTLFITPDALSSDLAEGDMIGVFFTNDDGDLVCAGSSAWTGSAMQVTAFGNDATTTQKDGFSAGEDVVWMAQSSTGIYNVVSSYSNGDGSYASDGVLFVVSLDYTYSCTGTATAGCTDATALNYDSNAVVNDGSCIATVVGCMDGHYLEYDLAANVNDYNLCLTWKITGCTDSAYTEYNDAANTDDGSCLTSVVTGCTDASALNYNAEANVSDDSCEYATPLVITTTVCTEATSVMMTGPWWGWDPAAGPVAASNGDGTWTFTFDVAPDADMEYLLVVDGVQENLVEANTASEDWSCTPITDYWSYANRQWTVGSGDVSNVYGTCGSECPTVEPEPTTASVEFTVDMNGVDQPSADYDQVTVNGSWNGWGAWGLPLTDEDADGIFTGTLELEAGTSFEYVVAVSGPADSWSGWGIQWGDGCSNANVSVTAGEVGSVTSSSLTPGCAEVLGCMDANATNYDSAATAQAYDQYGNLGCIFTSCDDIPEYGCIYGDGFGAFNAEFNADACVTYGGTPCEAAPTCEGTEATLTLMDSYGDGGGSVTIAGTNYELFTGASEDFALCLDLSSCISVTFVATDNYPGENSWSISDASGAVLAGAVAGDALFGSCVVGCMDASALNFDATAVIADNTLCEYSACEADEATLTLMDSYGDGGGSVTIAGTNYVLAGGASEDFPLCIDLSTCLTVTFVATDNWSTENSWSISDASGLLASGADTDGLFGGCVAACGDEDAENYNANADIVDNTLCEYSLVQGCMDATACNFDLAAEADNGSCTYAEAGFDCGGNCISGTLVTVDGGSYLAEKSWTIADCDGTELAAGGAPFAGCVDLGENYILNLVDSYGDGWDGTVMTILDATYTVETDVENIVIGSCGVAGCTDEAACNFSADATFDDGTCDVPAAGLDCDGNCISGTLVTVDGGSYPAEKSWDITSCDGTELASGGSPFAGCVDLGENYVLNLVDSYGDGWDGTLMTIADATYTVEAATAVITVGECIPEVEGCTDETASNYNVDATVENDSCISWEELAASLQAQLDAIVPEDGISQADVDAVQALLDAIVPEDGITQADVDAVQALLDAIVPEDGITQADVDAQADVSYGFGYGDGAASVTPEDGITQADVDAQADVSYGFGYGDGAASVTPEDGITQADVDAQADVSYGFGYGDGAASVTPEDGVTQADVDAAVDAADANSAVTISDLQSQLDEALASACAPIYVDIVAGWNILGYTLPYGQDVAATLSSIEQSILIVKDNDASVYWPEFGFNGIGDFIPGQGYQIKTDAATANYTWPNINGERIAMSPTVPQWAANLEADVHPNDIRSLVKVVNMLGQEVNIENQFKGEVVLYLYNDGTVEKKIVQ